MFIIYISCSILTISCRKGENAAVVDPNMVGTWIKTTGTNSLNTLIINDSGKSVYKECFNCAGGMCDCHEPSEGKAKIHNSILYIGFLPKFKIDAMPYESGGNWYMVLDGKTWKK